jgi:hypothetical protein
LRARVRNPAILIPDETTPALDAGTADHDPGDASGRVAFLRAISERDGSRVYPTAVRGLSQLRQVAHCALPDRAPSVRANFLSG